MQYVNNDIKMRGRMLQSGSQSATMQTPNE